MVKTLSRQLATHLGIRRPTNLSTSLLPRYSRWKPRQLVADCAMWKARHWWTGRLARMQR